MAFSSDGQTLYSGGGDRLRFWRVSDGELLYNTYTTGTIISLAVSPDGQLLVTGHSNGQVQFWDAATGTFLRAMTGHTGQVTCFSFSPDGTKLLSGSSGGQIRLLKVPSGSLIKAFDGNALAFGIYGVAVSPDGDKFAFSLGDGSVGMAHMPVIPPPTGDVNGDGCVDDIDLLLVIFAFGNAGGPEDLDGNGIVDDDDLLSVLFNFGAGC